MLLRRAEKAMDWQGREVCCTGCVHRELIREATLPAEAHMRS